MHRSVGTAGWCGAALAAILVVATLPLSAEDITIPNWKRSVPAAVDGEKAAVYFSNGDNELFFNVAPVDSPGAIDEVLDVLDRAYGIKRIYWRAPQIDQIIYQSVTRPEASHHGPWLTWMDHLFADLGTGDHMISAAHQRGMEVWGVASLFDHGSQAYIEYPNKGMGPFFTENKIRVEHPEWTPIDRAGIRRMSGPICFAYPEARKALVEMYVRLVRDKGYDGLSFHTYNENQGPRFDDEFGFNEPIVEAYRQRYGVDILTEDYDKQKLADLRGEFLTQFFRELRAALKPLSVKLSLMIDAKNPVLPQVWLAFPDILLSGRVCMDWRTYAREHLVDELFVYFHGSPFPTLHLAIDEVGNTGVEFATLASGGFPDSEQKSMHEAGVWRVISGQSEELEYGYFTPQPLEAVESDDFVARLSVLTQMGAGVTPVDMGRVIKALNDKSILVRRRALRLLVTINENQPQLINEDVIARVIELLDDPENIVRCTAVNTLGHLGGSDTIGALYEAVAQHANPMMHLLPGVPLTTLPDDRLDDLIRGLEHESPDVRILVMRLVSGGAARPQTWPAILENTTNPEWLVRWNAARALEFVSPPGANQRLFEMLDDPHPTVRNIAARNLSKRLKTDTRWVGGLHYQAIAKLTDMFASYDQDCTAEDAEWAWRYVGLALQRLGPRGHEVLERFLNQTDDMLLAHRAWHVLNIKEEDFDVVIISEEEAQAGYRAYPTKREHAAEAVQTPDEPQWMPYIVDDFNQAQAAEGEFGNAYAEAGRWRRAQLSPVDADGKGQSLHVVSGEGMASVTDSLRVDYRVNQDKLRVAFSVMRPQAVSGVTVWITSSNNWEGNLRMQINADGVTWFDGNGRPTVIPYKTAVGTWQRFELAGDLKKHLLAITAIEGDKRVSLVAGVPMTTDLKYNEFNSVVLIPSGPTGSGCYVDDFNYEVTNPFCESLAASMSPTDR